jgi:hypothetical protein
MGGPHLPGPVSRSSEPDLTYLSVQDRHGVFLFPRRRQILLFGVLLLKLCERALAVTFGICVSEDDCDTDAHCGVHVLKFL